MPGEKWGVVVILCFLLFYAFVVPHLPGDKGKIPDGLLAAMWLLWFGFFIGTYLSWRRRKDNFFCWDDDACWLEQRGSNAWNLKWSEYSHFRMKGAFIRQLILVGTNGSEFLLGVQGPEGNRSIEYRIRKVIRIMASKPSNLPQPAYRKKMPKMQAIAYGIGCLVAGTVGIQQLIAFQANTRSETPQPVSPIQLLVMTFCVLLFALWAVLFLGGLGSQNAKPTNAPAEPMPQWTLDNYLTFGALPSAANEVRFIGPSEKAARQRIDLERGVVWFASLAMAGMGLVGCYAGLKQIQSPSLNEMSPIACFMTAAPLFAISGLFAWFGLKSRKTARCYDDVLVFENDLLFVLRNGTRIPVANWQRGIKRTSGFLELDIEGQRTIYSLTSWSQEVRKNDGQ